MGSMLRPMKIHRRVKIGKFYKKLKPVAKLFKTLFRKMFRPAAATRQPRTDENLAFMTCIIKVNPGRSGWQKAVLSLLKNCQGSRCKMDQNGVVEVSGIADPNKLLKKLGRSKRVELHWFQFGQCSSYLFMPPSKKDPVKEEKQPIPPPPPPYNAFPLHRQYAYNPYPPQLLPSSTYLPY